MQFKNLAVRSGLFIITAISLAACGNTDKNKENKVESGHTPTEEVTAKETLVSTTAGISEGGLFVYFIVLLTRSGKSATVFRNQSFFQTYTLALQFVIILKVNICKHINSA